MHINMQFTVKSVNGFPQSVTFFPTTAVELGVNQWNRLATAMKSVTWNHGITHETGRMCLFI